MKRLIGLALFIGISGVSLNEAQAREAFPYWYIGLSGQLGFVSDADVDSGPLGVNEVQFDPGYAVSGSIGYRPLAHRGAPGGPRIELEYAYRTTDFDSFDTAAGSQSMDGDLQSNSIMMNLFYDIHTGGAFTPYIGAGAGLAFLEFQSPRLNTDSSTEEFAYQGMLGVFYSPVSLPDTEWGIGYRYFATSDPEFTTTTGNDFDHSLDSHNVEFNARFRF